MNWAINAFADWLDSGSHALIFAGSLLLIGHLIYWAFKHFRSEPSSSSRGKEAGTPEDQERSDDQMAVRLDPRDRRAVAAVFGEYAREMPELSRFADEVEGLYLIEVDH